jgi:hypothetical protein
MRGSRSTWRARVSRKKSLESARCCAVRRENFASEILFYNLMPARVSISGVTCELRSTTSADKMPGEESAADPAETSGRSNSGRGSFMRGGGGGMSKAHASQGQAERFKAVGSCFERFAATAGTVVVPQREGCSLGGHNTRTGWGCHRRQERFVLSG